MSDYKPFRNYDVIDSVKVDILIGRREVPNENGGVHFVPVMKPVTLHPGEASLHLVFERDTYVTFSDESSYRTFLEGDRIVYDRNPEVRSHLESLVDKGSAIEVYWPKYHMDTGHAEHIAYRTLKPAPEEDEVDADNTASMGM